MAYNNKKNQDKLFNMAKPVGGKDPNLYRRSPDGSIMYKHSYGKSSSMGW